MKELSAKEAMQIVKSWIGVAAAQRLASSRFPMLRDGWPEGAYRSTNDPVWSISIPPEVPRVGADRVVCVSKLTGKVVFDGLVGE